jgi:DNA-binding transcriptional MerR regulator
MRTQAEYELDLIKTLSQNGFTLEECANVLNDLIDNSTLGEAIARVYFTRNILKESYEPLSANLFNDPIAF